MRILCDAKDSHILSKKSNCVFVIFMFEILTNRQLTTSLILNNWDLYGNNLITTDHFVLMHVFAFYHLISISSALVVLSCVGCLLITGVINESINLSRVMRKPTMWFPNKSDTNRAVQAQKMARDWKFWI